MLNSKIIYDTFTTSSVTIASKSYTTTSVSVVKTGYTCIAVTVSNASGGGSGYCVISPQTNGSITIYNPYSSSVTATFTFRCVYIKD